MGEEHVIQMDLFVYTRFYYTVEEEHVIQMDLFVYTRFYYTVEEEHVIQMDVFVYTRFHSRNIFQVIAKNQVSKHTHVSSLEVKMVEIFNWK